jgi:hypothetical protein
MRAEAALPGLMTKPCIVTPLRVSSGFSFHDIMARSLLSLNPLLLGLAVTVTQVVIAVFLLAPEGPISYRYSTLVQHDSYWFANIIERGYQTIVPPISHKTMEISNVAFFPAYPLIAGALRYGLHFETDKALLVTAQAATVGFWSYFFLFCQRWNLSPALRFFGALSILAHPAAFFLVAAYSESLFLMALVGFIYWAGSQARAAKVWAALHGILMSATRIVGIPCAAAPLVERVCAKGWKTMRQSREWLRAYGSTIALTIVATFGAVLFFIYCQLRWGHWDIYMLTQSSGWAIVPDYLAVFKLSSYRWFVPALNDPTAMSQMSMTIGALLFIVVAVCEFIPAIRRNTNWPTRVGIYFCAAVIYYISVSGVASVEMESMLRYHFAVHALIVLAVLHFLRQFPGPPVYVRAFGMAAVALAGVAGLTLQGWYVWNFTRGNWVA